MSEIRLPKRFKCPFCGKWHELEWEKLPLDVNSEVSCCFYNMSLTIELEDTSEVYIRLETSTGCDENIVEVFADSIDYLPVTKKTLPTITLQLGENEEPCPNCKTCSSRLTCRSYFVFSRLRRGLSIEFEFDDTISEEDTTTKISKEDTTMKNNFFGEGIAFGPNQDENIKSTLMGVAVHNGDSWRVYDKKKKVITDIGDIQLGTLPLFVLPTTKLSEGDLIKDGDDYFFVLQAEATQTQTLCAKTGEMKTVVPVKNILGFSVYSKVLALTEQFGISEDFDMEKLAILSAVCGQTGKPSDGSPLNQLLPLVFLKDELGANDGMMKAVVASSMLSQSGSENNQMGQLLPLVLLKDELGFEGDMEKVLIMSSVMGGNISDPNNGLMGLLVMKSLLGEKPDSCEKPASGKKPAKQSSGKPAGKKPGKPSKKAETPEPSAEGDTESENT